MGGVSESFPAGVEAGRVTTWSASPGLLRDVLLLGAIWGASVVTQRLAVAEIPPLELVTFRVMASLVFFLPFLASFRLDAFGGRRLVFDCLVIGAFNPGLCGVLSGMALQYASSGVMAVLVALSPVFTALLALLVLREATLQRAQIAGLAVAFSGVVLLMATGSTGLGDALNGDLRGQALALLVALLMAGTAIYARRRLKRADPLAAAGLQMTGALLTVGPAALLVRSDLALTEVSAAAWLSVLFSGAVGLGLSFVVYLGMIARHGPTSASLSLNVMPVVAALLGALLLHESLTGPMLAGGGLVLVGVYLFTRRLTGAL